MRTIPHSGQEKKEGGALPERKEYTGLCSCCNSAAKCTYARDRTEPILQCEEFDGVVPPRMKVTHAASVSSTGLPKKPPGREEDPSLLGGLCGLCENRSICTFPKPEGGVWHCEEYR